MAGEHDEVDAGARLAHLLEEVHASHDRHAQIGDHQHRIEGGNFFQGLLAVRGAFCLVAPGANQLSQRVAQAHVVLNYEHAGIGRHVHISPPRRTYYTTLAQG